LLDIIEINLKNAKVLVQQMVDDQTKTSDGGTISLNSNIKTSRDEEEAKEVVEGYFDGEFMLGDNGRTYLVPQNYASKTQLVIGDRMKWILTPSREIFKLIMPAERDKVEGVFAIEGDNYIVRVMGINNPVKILKASATFAIKTQGLEIGDIVSILIPKNATPIWGAFVNVVKSVHDAEEFDPLSSDDFSDQDGFDEKSMFGSVISPDEIPKKGSKFDEQIDEDETYL
jgi:hypothetical protein